MVNNLSAKKQPVTLKLVLKQPQPWDMLAPPKATTPLKFPESRFLVDKGLLKFEMEPYEYLWLRV